MARRKRYRVGDHVKVKGDIHTFTVVAISHSGNLYVALLTKTGNVRQETVKYVTPSKEVTHK